MLIKLSDLLGKFKNTLLCTIKEYIHTIFTFFNKQGSSFIVFEDFASYPRLLADLLESKE